MGTKTVEVLVDDLDGSPAAETVRLGWNGEWRELDLSKRNLASLSRALERYWSVGRRAPEPVTARRRRAPQPRRAAAKRAAKAKRDPKVIRAWAIDTEIAVPARGRIPAEVERRYNEAMSQRPQ
jgi:nucleoid-associated protein Lsr2